MLLKLFIAGSICFILSKSVPGDPLDRILGTSAEQKLITNSENWNEEISHYRKMYGLDLPVFYLGVRMNYPDFIEGISSEKIQEHLKSIYAKTGNEPGLEAYAQFLNMCIERIRQEKNTSIQNQLLNRWIKTLEQDDLEITFREVQILADQLNLGLSQDFFHRQWKLFTPKIEWHGIDNQYHNWWTRYITGQWGKSQIDGTLIYERITQAFKWTLGINFTALALGFSMAILTGLYFHESKVLQWFALALFAAPIYWISTLFVQWFTRGGIMPVFSSVVIPIDQLDIAGVLKHYTLPTLSIVLGVWAFLHQQLSSKINDLKDKEFVLAAQFRGIKPQIIKWLYLLPNASYPLITSLTIILPALAMGAVAIELIFDIPGIGKLLYLSLIKQDWNMVFPLVFLNVILIVLVNGLAEWTYRWIDPRRTNIKQA